jgi:RNA polymerase sigma factor (sigma-70 family)
MDRYDSTMTPWYMDEGERERRAERFAIRAMLLQWIRHHMTICLTDMERDCVEAYYFQGRSYREAARDLHVHAATVLRTVRQAVRKLREAAEQDTMIQEVLRRHGGW